MRYFRHRWFRSSVRRWDRTVVGSQGFAAWQLFGPSTYQTQALVASFRPKIRSGTARGRRYQPRSVGHSVQAPGPRQMRTYRGSLRNDFKAASLQKHFWVRNAPYASTDPCNQLKSQQMRPPSERTKGDLRAPEAEARLIKFMSSRPSSVLIRQAVSSPRRPARNERRRRRPPPVRRTGTAYDTNGPNH